MCVCVDGGEDVNRQALDLCVKTSAPAGNLSYPGEAGIQATHVGSVLLTPTEKILWSPKAEDDVYGICPAGCLEQLLPGPKRRLLWKPGRRRLYPRGSFCHGIRKAGKSLVFTCESAGVGVCECVTPVWADFPYLESPSLPSKKPGNMGKGERGKPSLSPVSSQ